MDGSSCSSHLRVTRPLTTPQKTPPRSTVEWSEGRGTPDEQQQCACEICWDTSALRSAEAKRSWNSRSAHQVGMAPPTPQLGFYHHTNANGWKSKPFHTPSHFAPNPVVPKWSQRFQRSRTMGCVEVNCSHVSKWEFHEFAALP